MARRSPPKDECSSPSVRSRIAKEAAQAAVEEFTRGPALQVIVDKAVAEALTRLGFKMDDPEAMQENLRHLSAWVETMTFVRKKSIGTVVFGIISLFLTALGFGIATLIKDVHLASFIKDAH